jgi:rhodanese-related sulfurtransferase
MKRIIGAYQLVIILSSVLFTACAGGGNEDKGKTGFSEQVSVSQAPAPEISEETRLLLKDLSENGDYVNSREFPSLIKASIVNDLIGSNILIIDIRSAPEYAGGHIKSSVNRDFKDLPKYFMEGIKPFEYDRIIIVSADGQTASYTTSLLRLMGYGNVYAMRWGMSAWNQEYASKGWYAGCSSEYQDKLEKDVNESPLASSMPELNTGMTTGEGIGASRFKKLFEAGLNDVMIDAADVFANPGNYYIINYDRRDKYESGHIPGAVRYKPGATLGFINEMATIPFDKPVVVYCGTGHNSGFVTAYLRLFGYDAHTLKYGNNGFMFETMVEDRATLSWLPFGNEDVNNYEVVR